jgi:hypothetical protein
MWHRHCEGCRRFSQLPHSSKQMRAAYQSFDFALTLECHRVISPMRDVTGDSRLIGRVRFLRVGLVTPLPGGLGIDPAGTMTGARGASLWARSMVRVTPASSRSHEARPGLSRGINLRGKYR